MKKQNIKNLTTADTILNELNKSIFVQKDTKETIAKNLRLYCFNIENDFNNNNNMLFIGSTKYNRIFLAKKISNILDVPYIKANINFSSKNSIENAFIKLYLKSGKDLNLTEHSVIYVDALDNLILDSLENDKLCQDDLENLIINRDKIKITVDNEEVIINPRHILFIFGGNFDNLNEKNYISALDLIEYGMNIRLAYNFLRVHIDPLTRQQIYTILSNSNNTLIAKYKSLFKEQNYKLIFSDGALFQIADKLLDRNLDIIDVDIICREFIYDILFELPSSDNNKSCIITKNVVNGLARPIIKA